MPKASHRSEGKAVGNACACFALLYMKHVVAYVAKFHLHNIANALTGNHSDKHSVPECG
jgi:hypothetical protein